MAKLTKFTFSPSGELVYKSTGKAAPASYTFKKNVVYGANGRRIGSLSRKLTKTEAAKIAKAERNRRKRKTGIQRKLAQRPKDWKPSPKSQNIGKEAFTEYGEGDWDEFDTTEFPEAEDLVKEDYARRVRMAALSVAPDSLRAKIQALSTEAIYEAYLQDEYIFEIYFQYHTPVDAPHKSDISVWFYQFVARIEQYMGVKS